MSKILATAGLAISLAGGCGPSRLDSVRMNGATNSELQPTNLLFKEATLVLAGTELPVQVESKLEGTKYMIVFKSFGEILEREIYESTETRFAVSQLLQEHYVPVLPILEFPLKLSGERTWEGHLKTAGIARASKATILSRWKPYKLFGKEVESLQVDVMLAIESGAPKPAVRDLNFVFVPKMGLVERSFGSELKRLPPKESSVQ